MVFAMAEHRLSGNFRPSGNIPCNVGKYPDNGGMDAPTDISAEVIRRTLLYRARRYCDEHGASLSAIGLAAVNDSKFLTRVERGFGFNIATYQKVMDWLDAQSAPAPKKGEVA